MDNEELKNAKKLFIDRCHQEYREDFIRAVNTKIEMSNAFDKAIITLSSGAIFLSMIFISDVINTNYPVYAALLYASWISYAVTIISLLLGFMLSQKVMDYVIFSLNEMLAVQTKFENIASIEETPSSKKMKKYGRCVSLSNAISMIFFVIGTILLLTFSYINIEKGKPEMNNQITNDLQKKGISTLPTPVRPEPPPVKK